MASNLPIANIEGPTRHQYSELQRAYDFFSRELFEGRLPPALITLTRKKNARGYFWPGQYSTRADEEQDRLDEIALNPEHMRNRTDREVVSTLVHEMVHLWDQHFGKPGKNGYHGKVWAMEMERVGLIPSSTGEPGGKKTGPKVSHYIEEGGPYAKAWDLFAKTGFVITYMVRDVTDQEVRRAASKKASKTKFHCPSCEAQAWGKPTLRIECAECDEMMISDEEGDN